MKSQTENQRESILEQSPEYETILHQIEPMIDASQQEQRRFVEQRLAKLGTDAPSGELSHVWSSVHRGFIGPDMTVRRNLLVDPFLVDDPSLYMTLFQVIQKFKEVASWKDKPLRDIMPGAIQWTLSTYFGNPYSTNHTEAKNRRFYTDHSTRGSGAIHLDAFKEQSMAVCAEKGAAAQNLLAFVGLESDLIASGECRIPADAQEGGHYFILLHAPSGNRIWDPTNPSLVRNGEGQVTSYGPAIYSISPKQSKDLLAGKPTTVEHADIQIQHDGTQTKHVTQRLYKIPKHS